MLPVLTLNNLMQFDDRLFDGAQIPADADLETLVNVILMHYGDMQVLIPDWPVLRHAINTWFAAHALQLIRLWLDYTSEYNPVYNKDGYYEEERTPNLTRSRQMSDNTTERQDGKSSSSVQSSDRPGAVMTESGSNTNQYKGFNASNFTDVTKELPGTVTTASGENTGSTSGSGTNQTTRTTSGSTEETEMETGSDKIQRHEYGNIGVTMASQMLRDDTSFWSNYSWYDVVAKLWAVDNLVMIY